VAGEGVAASQSLCGAVLVGARLMCYVFDSIRPSEGGAVAERLGMAC